ncbi:MAG: hypothetical protein A3K41_00645 [Chloroflexi bacterium RIFOXYD12_FULL_57_15]|nr:MAG: hypothetical protein A3K41_00645 [Chloroflexi bacterium RIFOXYD12_FULL_57_15]
MKKVLPLILGLTVLLAACAPKATPTIDAASVQASAVAMAFTMAAQTQAALPTATATLPPTETPTLAPPSPTFALPTFPSVLPTATTSASGDPCNSLMAPNPGGPKSNLLIDNRTKAAINLSLWLSPTPFSCGYARLPTIASKGSYMASLPEGCYYPAVYINDPKKQRSLSGPSFCIHSTDKITLVVDYTGFKVLYP